MSPIDVAQAIKSKVCRICGRPLQLSCILDQFARDDTPYAPVNVTTQGGRECAHTACLRPTDHLMEMSHVC